MSLLINPLPNAPTPQDIEKATEVSRKLSKALAAKRILTQGKKGKRLTLYLDELPEVAVELLNSILVEMSQGNPVTVLPASAELTTQQAADFLSVSRPFLIGLLEENKLPFRKVGTHRRIRTDDLVQYKQGIDAARRETLDKLSEMAQDDDMGY